MPRAHDPYGVPADRQPSKGMGGPIPDFGQYTDFTDTLGLFVENLLKQIKDWTGIDLYWMLDWSWTTNAIMQLVAQANDLFAWLQNPIQRPPNLLTRPSFSSPSAIAEAPDWSWDPVISLGTVTGPGGVPRTDPQGSARTIADGVRHSMMSNAISERSALTPGQILTCQIHALVEAGFTAADDQAIRLELVPSRLGVLQEPVVLASCGVPTGDPEGWIAAPDDAKSVFFDVDYTVPVDDSPDTVELRLVVGESAGGGVPVRFDGARVAAAGGFLVVLADLFDAGRIYLTDLWNAVTAWLEDVFDADNWTALKTDTDAAFDAFVRRVKRALHHADADIFHPPATSDILSNALRANPWFGWLFDMVDSWLQPVLLIGKAGTAFWETVWHAVTAFAEAPTASGAWSTLMSAINGAWNTFVDAILQAWGSTKTHADFASPGTATTAALKNNEWFGWLFEMVDTWLQPVLRVGKAVTDFGDALWHAVTAYAANPLASGAWPALVNALNDAWNGAVDAILNAWGSSKTHADFASPAEATEKVIKNNPVTGWLFGDTFEGGSWLDNALAPITNFFDSIRKYINQMVEPLHWGYFDTNWAWVPALTTPDTQLPGDGPVMTPGSNDGDGGGIAPGADTSIPSAPKNVSAIPWWDITNPNFPAGNITYAIAAVKSGVEGPATQVKTYVGTLFPPNSSTHVDLRWDAVSGASSYRVYRKANGYSTTTPWRLVASPTSAGTLLSPVVDKTARTGGTVAAPKTDAELAAQIVTTVQSTAATAQSTASSAASTASAAQSTANAASTTAGNAQTAASAAQSAANTANSNANTAIANNQALANVVTRGAQGSLDGDANNVMVEAAVADLRGSLSDLQSQMYQLQAGQGGPAGGVKFTGSSMGWQPGGSTNWLMIGNGSPVQRASQAYGWTKTGAGKYVHGIWKPKKLTSAQQSATMVFQTAPAYPSGFDPKTYGGSNLIIIRAKADGSHFPFVQIWQNKAQFGYWDGSRHLVGSAFSVSGTATGGFVFRQVDGNNPYKFELLQGSSIVATYTYTSSQAPYGPDYLSVGMGMMSGSGILGGEFAPGDINQFSAKDAGAGVDLIADGVGGTMRRLSTAGYTIGPNQVITVAAPFYDEVDWISAGIHPLLTGSNAGFTVDDGGLFVCFAGFYKPSYNTSVGSATFYSGVPGAADLYAWQDAGTTGSYMNGVGIVHVNPGEAIMPAPINYSASNIQVVGEVTGKATFFSIAKVG